MPALSVAGDLSVRSLNGQLPERLLRLDGTGTVKQLVVSGDVIATKVRNVTADTSLNGYNVWQEINNRLRVRAANRRFCDVCVIICKLELTALLQVVNPKIHVYVPLKKKKHYIGMQ